MKNIYIIGKPKCDIDFVEQFVRSVEFVFDGEWTDTADGMLDEEDVAKIYSDHLEDDFYPDLEKFMMSDRSVVHIIEVDEDKFDFDKLTEMKKAFRTYMCCEDGTSANHIHCAENWEMNDQIGECID